MTKVVPKVAQGGEKNRVYKGEMRSEGMSSFTTLDNKPETPGTHVSPFPRLTMSRGCLRTVRCLEPVDRTQRLTGTGTLSL